MTRPIEEADPNTRTTLPEPLTRLLLDHRASHATHYPPSDNSDHGPMAYLAMHGLGMSHHDIERFAQRYRPKLAPLPPPENIVGNGQLRNHFGRRASYPALLHFFDAEIANDGWRETVARHLPSLISGWVKDAFHPLIRLGYGIEFEAPSEIAAGLSYLTITGDDPSLAAFAQRAPTVSEGRDYIDSVRALLRPEYARGSFNARYQRIVEGAALQPAAGSSDLALAKISRACLEIFHATHDFFALHLVTSSHAFRICAPWAGRNAHSLFSVGIAAAYLAIGAPPFDPIAHCAADLPIDALSRATDEHDIKLAYSCAAQARAYGDSTYEWAADRYLAPRLPPGGRMV